MIFMNLEGRCVIFLLPGLNCLERQTSLTLCQTVEEMVDKILVLGVVEPPHSPWSSPVVLVDKKHDFV